jgi:hypothetical protein
MPTNPTQTENQEGVRIAAIDVSRTQGAHTFWSAQLAWQSEQADIWNDVFGNAARRFWKTQLADI